MFHLGKNGDLMRVFKHFLRNSWLFNNSILKGILEWFFPSVFVTGKQAEKSAAAFLQAFVCILRVLFPEKQIKKFPSVSQMSTLFHTFDLSVHKLIENHAPFFIRKTGIMFYNAFPFELLGFGGFLIPPLPNLHLWGKRIISYHFSCVN